jgi:hypothetical protein
LIDYYKYIKISKYFFYINNNLYFIFREKKINNQTVIPFLFIIYFIDLIINNPNFEPKLENKIIIIKIKNFFKKT